MSRLKSVIDILKLLDKSNCRACGEATCLAFAASVHKGSMALDACTRLSQDILQRYGGDIQKRKDLYQETAEALSRLKNQIPGRDLEKAAQRVDGYFSHGKLTLKVLGKDFSVDTAGKLFSEIHVNAWVAAPFLSFVLYAKGTSPTGDWISFRELKGGKEWQGLFGQQCEKRLKRVADNHTSLFEDMLSIFNGKQVQGYDRSDVSIVLYPLPKVPVMICYWKPDDGMPSDLSIFFDARVEDNVSVESIYTLCVGMTRMFEKVVRSHGAAGID